MLWLVVLGLIIAVIVVFVRLAELKKEIGWHRKHVHDLATKLSALEDLVSILRARELAEAAPRPEVAKAAEAPPRREVAEPALGPVARGRELPVTPPPAPPEPEVARPAEVSSKPEVPEPALPPVVQPPERKVARPPEFAPKPEVARAAEPAWKLEAPEPARPAARAPGRPVPPTPPQVPPKPIVPPAPAPPPAPAVPPAGEQPPTRPPEPEIPVLPPKPERPVRPEPVAPRAPQPPAEPDRREALERVARAAAEAPPPEAAGVPKDTVAVPRQAAAGRAPAAPTERAEPAVTKPPPPPPRPPTPAAERPRRRGDIETTIGVRWLSRIGMVAVLIALAFLVKYLYDEEIIRITPPMVIGAGLLVGIGLMAGGEMANRREYEIQSQVLTGGGAAVLYLTLWAGLKLYGIIGESPTFVAMVVVTAVTASQALRHDSETIASFAWVAGYLVPLFVGERADAAGDGGGSAVPLFVYLALLSVGVFVVAQRRPWPFFTGLALMGAYSGAAYMFRVSDGSLEWTLGYLLLITAGMLWVAASRKGEEGGNFGAIGGIAGYLITGVVMVVGHQGSVYVPYLYLLMLSGGLLFLSRIYGWPALTWCAVAGSLAGFLLLYYTGATQVGNWLLLYVILSVAGAVAASAGGEESAEPLAITAVGSAYGAAAFLVWAPGARSITGDALFAYLALLAAGSLFVTSRFEWPTFSRLSLSAAFLATGLLYQHVPGPELNLHALIYAALLGAAAVAVTAHLEDQVLGGIVSAGVFVSLALTGVLGRAQPAALVPAYLTVAAVVTVGVIEWRKWYGLEWLPLVGVWLLHAVWRIVTPHYQPDPSDLAFTSGYWLIFLALTWLRHGARQSPADVPDALLACTTAGVYFAFGMYDLSPLFGHVLGPGGFALALFAVYLCVGLTAVKRRPAETYFGPFLLGISVVSLTVAMPLLLRGYPVAVAWAAEATILVGLGFLYRSLALRVGGLIVLILGLFHALAIDSRVAPDTYQLLLNSRALSILAVIAALYVCSYWYLRHRERAAEDERWLGSGLGSAATALLLWIASIETWTYVGWTLQAGAPAQQFALSAVWLAFGAVFVQLALARGIAYLRWAALALLGATIGKVFLAGPPLAVDTYILLLNNEALPCLGVAALLYQVAYWYARNRESVHRDERWVGTALAVAATALLFWTASAETWREVGWVLEGGSVAQHFALSAVWLVFGAAFVQIGIWRRFPYLHWTTLALFGATIGKVFLIDPALRADTYLLLLNSQAVPCLVVAALLYQLAYWYACHPEQINDDDRWLSTGLGVAATALLLWTASAETWREVGWVLGGGSVAQHFALSGVWLVFGAAFVQIGIWRRIAYFHWAALALFTATVYKVFVIDPPLTADTYILLVNSHALPLLLITALLGQLAWWNYRRGGEPVYGTVLAVAGSLLLFWVCCSETWMYLGWEQQVARAMQQLALSLVWLVFGMAAAAIGLAKRVAALRWVGLGLFTLTGVKAFAIDPQLSAAIYQPLVNHHAFPLIVIAAMLYAIAAWYGRVEEELPEEEQLMDRVLPVIASVVLWWVLSSEAWRYVGWTLGEPGTAQQYALSAVWTLYGAALVAVGLLRSQAAYRWTALVLFAITIAKVGFFDLQALDLPFRILAFLGLGAVLIVVSFGYQRLVRAQEESAKRPADT